MDLICEEQGSDSPFVERIWRNTSEYACDFLSIAQANCWMVVTKHAGQIYMTIRGPETMATTAFCPPEGEWLGIQFKLGTFMPNLPAKMIMNRCDMDFPNAANQSFWLNSSTWQFPNFDNVDSFLNRLGREGLIMQDPVVAAILRGEPVSMSLRTVQRRFVQTTGLSYGTISQIERARQAVRLLTYGTPILDVVEKMSYADQPHLTRSLKQFIGMTPAQITSDERRLPMSLLFKTGSLE